MAARNLPPGSGEQIEQRLRDLGMQITWPAPETDANARLLAALPAVPQQDMHSTSLRERFGASRFTALAAGLAIVVLAVALLLALLPDVRTGVAERLGLPGISLSPANDATPDVPSGSNLYLGSPISAQELGDTPGYRPLAPPDTLPEPDSIWSLNRGGYQQVSYVWDTVAGLPDADEARPTLLISQFEGRIDEGFIGKLLHTGTSVSALEVNGQRAYWLSGAPHVFFYVDANGEVSEDTVRLAQQVLLWQAGDIVLRIEGALSLEQALEIATALRTPVQR